jgi:3-phenylpropionate/trans-cinnamate dioxygenase ferredoxin reductase subunit
LSTQETIVVVGAGHAGVQAAASLREEGFAGQIELVSGEHALPYQRPPLSKKFMKEQMAPSDLLLRGEQFYADKDIGLRLGDKVLEIDRADKSVQLASGDRLAYDHLILATGSKPRSTDLVGAELDGVQRLCEVDDAIRLRQALRRVGNVVIVGAGFIGLEIAATATAMGTAVHVVELANRPMARVVSEPVSSFFADMHRAAGVQLSLGVSVAQIIGSDGRVKEIQLSDGRRLPTDVLILGIGAQARDELARAAGLACGNGIEVNAMMTTSDPSISAIGDCASHHSVWNRFRTPSIRVASWRASSSTSLRNTTRFPGSGVIRPIANCRLPGWRLIATGSSFGATKVPMISPSILSRESGCVASRRSIDRASTWLRGC